MHSPIKYCAGTSHDFLLPIDCEKTESTNGAHSNFMLNGQIAKEKSACKACYVVRMALGFYAVGQFAVKIKKNLTNLI